MKPIWQTAMIMKIRDFFDTGFQVSVEDIDISEVMTIEHYTKNISDYKHRHKFLDTGKDEEDYMMILSNRDQSTYSLQSIAKALRKTYQENVILLIIEDHSLRKYYGKDRRKNGDRRAVGRRHDERRHESDEGDDGIEVSLLSDEDRRQNERRKDERRKVERRGRISVYFAYSGDYYNSQTIGYFSLNKKFMNDFHSRIQFLDIFFSPVMRDRHIHTQDETIVLKHSKKKFFVISNSEMDFEEYNENVRYLQEKEVRQLLSKSALLESDASRMVRNILPVVMVLMVAFLSFSFYQDEMEVMEEQYKQVKSSQERSVKMAKKKLLTATKGLRILQERLGAPKTIYQGTER